MIKINETWRIALDAEWEEPYFQDIKAFLREQKAAGKTIYPAGKLLFNAFDTTPLPNVRVVILGQDPYHGANQAMGLSFSVPDGVRVPPSLVNVYKELKNSLNITPPQSGDLTRWAEQGVFLLNTALTVEAGKAGSHSKIGWQLFTDAVIRAVSKHCENVVFMLWGNHAKAKRVLIDTTKHCVLEAAHPSPLAGNAFQGCNHFVAANDYLLAKQKEPIIWQLA
jgi:uracil-DNA glycosylase